MPVKGDFLSLSSNPKIIFSTDSLNQSGLRWIVLAFRWMCVFDYLVFPACWWHWGSSSQYGCLLSCLIQFCRWYLGVEPPPTASLRSPTCQGARNLWPSWFPGSFQLPHFFLFAALLHLTVLPYSLRNFQGSSMKLNLILMKQLMEIAAHWPHRQHEGLAPWLFSATAWVFPRVRMEYDKNATPLWKLDMEFKNIDPNNPHSSTSEIIQLARMKNRCCHPTQ